MRVRKIQHIMLQNQDAIRKGLNQPKENDGFHYIKDYSMVTKAISNIQKTGLIDTEISQLEEDGFLLFTDSQRVKFTPERYNKLSAILRKIMTKILTIDELANNSYKENYEPEEALIVSFPDRELSLEAMEGIVKQLNKTFKILSHFDDFNSDKIKIQDFDIGTNWIVLLLGTSWAVDLFGKIVATIQEARARGLIIKSLEKQLDLIHLEAEEKQQFNNTIAKINSSIYEQAAEKLIDENDLEKSEELVSRMSKALEQVHSLHEAGVGFQPGINSALEVVESFPTLEDQQSLDLYKNIESLKKISEADE